MHEMSLAAALVDDLLRVLEREGAQRATRVCLRIGALAGVESEALALCFPYAAEGTAVAEAELEIETVPVRIHCGSCGADSGVEIPLLRCGHCSSDQVSINGGREITVASLEVE